MSQTWRSIFLSALALASVSPPSCGRPPDVSLSRDGSTGEPDGGNADARAPTGLRATCSAWIAVEADRFDPASSEIFAIRTDGSEVRNISASPADDDGMAWSRDGTRIAFESDRGGTRDVYVADLDGGAIDRVAQSDGDDHISASRLAWTPDSSELVVQLAGGPAGPGLYVVSAKGETSPRRVARSGEEATFSPDGGRILYEDAGDIYSVGAKGADRALRVSDGSARTPAWSPGGERILFESERSGNVDLWVASADGRSLSRLTRHPGRDANAHWHPDGTRILFARQAAGDIDRVYVAETGGANAFPIIDFARVASFSGDGANVAARISEFGIAASEPPIALTNDDGTGYAPLHVEAPVYGVRSIRWQPCPRDG